MDWKLAYVSKLRIWGFQEVSHIFLEWKNKLSSLAYFYPLSMIWSGGWNCIFEFGPNLLGSPTLPSSSVITNVGLPPDKLNLFWFPALLAVINMQQLFKSLCDSLSPKKCAAFRRWVSLRNITPTWRHTFSADSHINNCYTLMLISPPLLFCLFTSKPV